jgi:hypothetical protein
LAREVTASMRSVTACSFRFPVAGCGRWRGGHGTGNPLASRPLGADA